MSWTRHLQHPNTGLAFVVLFLVALVTAPVAMSSIRRSAEHEVEDAPAAAAAVVTQEPSTPEASTSAPEIVGESGSLRAVIGTPAMLAANTALEPMLAHVSLAPGVHPLDVRAADGDPLVAVATQPFDAGSTKSHDGYYTGKWATKGLASRNPQYAPPQGYIPVTPQNENTQVTESFRLADFLTHDQQNVWPKVLVLQPRILDKLELIRAGLERRGLSSDIRILSGFRTPQYNEQGVGKKGGRAEASRHQYGDASDIYVDADGDHRMDDLNHDGKIDVKDARVIYAVAEEVEAQHPELVGGLSAYNATGSHGPFVHVDARGTRARW